MNCQNFECIAGDLARGSLLEAATRESALRHARDCVRCAARLTDERALSDGLRAAAAVMAASSKHTIEAPPRVESALLAAFRERNARSTSHVAPVAAGKDSPIVAASALKADAKISSPVAFRSWSWSKTFGAATAAAVAAAILLLVLLPAGTRLWQTATNEQAAQSRVESSEPLRIVSQNLPVQNGTATSDSTLTSAPGNHVEIAATGGARDSDGDDGRARNTGVLRLANRLMTTTPVSYRMSPERKNDSRNTSLADGASVGDADEIATDFMLLEHGGATLREGDGGQLVRVELPRSALAAFGLPVNHERADERIKADVLMGDDGIARAIRFVR